MDESETGLFLIPLFCSAANVIENAAIDDVTVGDRKQHQNVLFGFLD